MTWYQFNLSDITKTPFTQQLARTISNFEHNQDGDDDWGDWDHGQTTKLYTSFMRKFNLRARPQDNGGSMYPSWLG